MVGTAQAATVNVVPGWNLLGYSDAEDVVVANAFGYATKVTTVWKWNATTASWAFYSSALPDGGQASAFVKRFAPADTAVSVSSAAQRARLSAKA